MKKLFISIFVIVLAVFLLYPTIFDGKKRSYSEFYSLLEENKIDSATIEKESIKYSLKGEKGRYTTDNPSSLTLKEEMLKNGVRVKDSTLNSLDSTLNTLFNLLFFAIVFYGIYALFSYSHKTFKIVRKTGITFSDICGMEEEKKEILQAVKDLKENKKTIKGIILEGPPGNGKTMFAKALASECKINFIASRGADYQGALMGLGAFKVKLLFKKAKRNRPCIIFIDEFDSIGEKRNYNGSGIDKENNRILTTLLNEMDGFNEQSGIIVMAATNSYSSLDPALVRPGRFDLKFRISNPDDETRKSLIRMYLKPFRLSEPLTEERLSVLFNGFSSAAIKTLLMKAKAISQRKNSTTLGREELSEASKKTALPLNGKGL